MGSVMRSWNMIEYCECEDPEPMKSEDDYMFCNQCGKMIEEKD